MSGSLCQRTIYHQVMAGSLQVYRRGGCYVVKCVFCNPSTRLHNTHVMRGLANEISDRPTPFKRSMTSMSREVPPQLRRNFSGEMFVDGTFPRHLMCHGQRTFTVGAKSKRQRWHVSRHNRTEDNSLPEHASDVSASKSQRATEWRTIRRQSTSEVRAGKL